MARTESKKAKKGSIGVAHGSSRVSAQRKLSGIDHRSEWQVASTTEPSSIFSDLDVVGSIHARRSKSHPSRTGGSVQRN
jgi:hypothetical protein